MKHVCGMYDVSTFRAIFPYLTINNNGNGPMRGVTVTLNDNDMLMCVISHTCVICIDFKLKLNPCTNLGVFVRIVAVFPTGLNCSRETM